MIHDRTISAARTLARHCPELTQRSAPTKARETRFADAGADLARAFAARLGGLIGGARVQATCRASEPVAASALPDLVGGLAAHAVFGFAEANLKMLMTIPLRDLIGLTDRVFGGDGAMPDVLPEEVPLTADLVAAQVEALLAESLATALAPLAAPAIHGRAAQLSRLDPFAAVKECVTFVIEVAETGKAPWTLRFTACAQSFATLFAADPKPASAPVRRQPWAAPFADLPLALEAVVAEFSLPLSRLSNLKPGDTIPLALSREVPLKISETIVAYGSVGTADERVALQLTRVF